MMCIISHERIAVCTQVEGSRGEIFAASPIPLQSRCKQVPNKPIPKYGHSWSSLPEWLFGIGDWQSEKKRWNCDGREICNTTRGIDTGSGVSRHRDDSVCSDGACPLWQRHSARTELIFADAIAFEARTNEILKEVCCSNGPRSSAKYISVTRRLQECQRGCGV